MMMLFVCLRNFPRDFAGSQPEEWANSRYEMHIEEDACKAQPHSLHAS